MGVDLNLMHIPNGVTLPDVQAVEQVDGPQKHPEVLYLARLHPRKRPMYFARAAKTAGSRWPEARFSLVGPDEGEGPAVSRSIAAMDGEARVKWSGSEEPDRTLLRMSRASIYALPSTDEPFPMSVLEAMSVGLP
ncbi:TPA: glycosyltransferase, partial [Shigella flexneri]|nr:glycosyltransferase [Shigella flexneri]